MKKLPHRHLPPDDAFRGKIGNALVQTFFAAMGSPQASTYAANARGGGMQKTRALVFTWFSKARSRWCSTPPRCIWRPATPWSSAAPVTPGATRTSSQPCRIAFSLHDGAP